MFARDDRVTLDLAVFATSPRHGRTAERAGTVVGLARPDGPRAGMVYVRWDGTRVCKPVSQNVLVRVDAFEREAHELGQSAKFMEFLSERSSEPGGVSLAQIEARVSGADPVTGGPADNVDPSDGAASHGESH